MAVAMWGWHVPGPYQLALREPLWHDAEHLTFFATSLLFWWSVVRPWPFTPHWPAWSIPATLLLADVQNTVIAAALTFSGRVLYPIYDQGPRLGGLSALDDQVMAGVVMVPGSLVFLVRDRCDVRLLSRRASSRSDQADADAGIFPRAFDLLKTPVIGALLRARRSASCRMRCWWWPWPSSPTVHGRQMASMNLAGLRPALFVIVGLLRWATCSAWRARSCCRAAGRRLRLATPVAAADRSGWRLSCWRSFSGPRAFAVDSPL